MFCLLGSDQQAQEVCPAAGYLCGECHTAAERGNHRSFHLLLQPGMMQKSELYTLIADIFKILISYCRGA